MKTLKTAVFLSLFAATICYAQPKLEITGGNTFDWGKVKPVNSPLKTTLVLKNIGNELLKIEEVKPACGCTNAPISKKELQPGDTASIFVSLNIGSNSGQVTKYMTITSNDPTNSPLSYGLKAEITRDLAFLPAQFFHFNQIYLNQKATTKISLRNLSSEEIKVSDIELPDGVESSLGKTASIMPGKDLEISISLTPKEKGFYKSALKMKTTSADNLSLEIPVYGNVTEVPAKVPSQAPELKAADHK